MESLKYPMIEMTPASGLTFIVFVPCVYLGVLR